MDKQNLQNLVIGKTIDQAKQILQKVGIENFIVTNNFVKPLQGSNILVTNVKIRGDVAELVVGSFKLDI